MITVIAPHARPEFSANLLANFRRQRGVEARLLVVENGPADMATSVMQLGAWNEPGTIIRSGNHQSDAMNAGLEWMRAHGGGAWARFDDDDYYGPDYLADVAASLVGDGLVVSGTPWRFVMLDDGLHQFQGAGEFTGGSLAASSAAVPDFPRDADDDLRWCRTMREHGARFVQREAGGYCYDRRSRGAPRVIPGGPAVTRFGFGESLFYGQMPMNAVDRPDSLTLQRVLPRPSDDEIFAEVTGP